MDYVDGLALMPYVTRTYMGPAMLIPAFELPAATSIGISTLSSNGLLVHVIFLKTKFVFLFSR